MVVVKHYTAHTVNNMVIYILVNEFAFVRGRVRWEERDIRYARTFDTAPEVRNACALPIPHRIELHDRFSVGYRRPPQKYIKMHTHTGTP